MFYNEYQEKKKTNVKPKVYKPLPAMAVSIDKTFARISGGRLGLFKTYVATCGSFVFSTTSGSTTEEKTSTKASAASLTMTACSEPSMSTRGGTQPAFIKAVITSVFSPQFLMVQARRRLDSPCTPGWSMVPHHITNLSTTSLLLPTCEEQFKKKSDQLRSTYHKQLHR